MNIHRSSRSRRRSTLAGIVALGAVAAIGVVRDAGAAGNPTTSTFTPIVPCRLADTRSDANHVGTRSTPLGAGETVPFAVWGTNGNCTIPNTATGIVANVTAVNPSADSYITIYPADAATRPTSANLNPVAHGTPTPNSVTVGLSATGAIDAFNYAGTVDLVIDVVGYYVAAPAATSTTTPAPETMMFSGLDAVAAPSGALNPPVYTTTLQCLKFTAFSTQAMMPLDLPIGAKPTTIQIRYLDQSAGTLNFTLYRGEPGISDTVAGGLATIGTNSSDFHRSDEFPLTNPPAVSAQNAYWIQMTGGVNTTPADPVFFCGALVTYTM